VPAATRTIDVTETCLYCPRGVTITRNGVAIVRADGYTGVTADHGDPVCTDHWCPHCHGAHVSAEDFQACADGAASDGGCPDAFYDSMTGR
jgi:hypothetical protein